MSPPLWVESWMVVFSDGRAAAGLCDGPGAPGLIRRAAPRRVRRARQARDHVGTERREEKATLDQPRSV
eukprot:5332501-Pyramimonas_sp.AAC.1